MGIKGLLLYAPASNRSEGVLVIHFGRTVGVDDVIFRGIAGATRTSPGSAWSRETVAIIT